MIIDHLFIAENNYAPHVIILSETKILRYNFGKLFRACS